MENAIEILRNLEKSKDPNVALEGLQQVHVFLTTSLIDYTKFDQFIFEAFPPEEDHGLIHFLQCHIGKKSYEKGKVESLRILQWLLDNPNPSVKTLMWGQCKRILRVATLIWDNQRESSSTQQEAIECIIIFMENYHRQILIAPGDFELATLYGKLLPCSEKSAYTPTVRGKMFHCLGILAAFGVDNFLQKEAKYLQLLNHLIYTLKCQVDSVNQHVEGSILQGCIKGLDKFLAAYQTKLSKDDPKLKDLYEKLEQIIDPKCSIENDAQTIKLKRREFQRTGLEFVSHHSSFLSFTLFERHEQWFNDLLSWAKSSNADDSKVGMRAMLVFLDSVCAYATKLQTENSSQSQVCDENRKKVSAFIKFFSDTFKHILDKKDATKNEKTIAVKGAGLLATICQDSNIVEQLFSKMIRIIEGVIVELNMPVVDKYSGSHALLPTYLESAGNLLQAVNSSDLFGIPNRNASSYSKISQNSQSRLTVVENLSILLITSYPDLSEKYRYFAPMSLLKVIHGLRRGAGTGVGKEVKNTIQNQSYGEYEQFLERVIHEGMTHVIASPTQVEADILVESYNRSNAVNSSSTGSKGSKGSNSKSVYNRLGLRTVKFYTSFWIGLVNKKAFKPPDSVENINAESEAREIRSVIYDCLLDWVLKTVGKLDLSLEFVDEDENEEGDEENINVADPIYNTKAAVVKDFQLFVNIVDFLSDFLLKTESTLFSRWVDIFMDAILKYIQEHPLVSGFYRILALVFEMMRRLEYFKVESTERSELLERCCQFLQGLVLKIQEFRDDLLLAVLEVWLSAPNPMILQSCTSVGDTLLCVFRTGKNWLPLAQKGVEAIERWFQIEEFPEDEMERLFNKLFPVLQSFFTTAESPEDETSVSEAVSSESLKRPKSISASKSRSIRNKNKAGGQNRLLEAVGTELQETTLRTLQLNILKIFGCYGHLLDVDNQSDSEQIGFSVDGKCLKYVVPFQDIKPDLFIDDFFPRLLKLCHSSTHRQLRSSACEVLHSFTLYFIGHSANENSSVSDSLDLFRRIFSTVIELGCDSDIVIKQLFNPLAVQIIHWCTSRNHRFSEFILNIVVDGLVQSEDPSKRDFSGVCLQEYFSWCLKHRNDEQAKQVLKFLMSLSQHAAPQYRQGSVLGFNHLYRSFRENPELVNEFTFQLLHSYLTCLDLSSSSLHTQEVQQTFQELGEKTRDSELTRTTIQAIQHLQRILVKKKENFNFVLRGRKIPAEFSGGTLQHLAEWLLRKSGESLTLVCRQQCFKLLTALCPCLKNISDVQGFVETFQPSQLLEIAEKSFTLSLLPFNEFDSQSLVQALEISSDFYAFLTNAQFSGVEVLLRHPESKFAHNLETFLKKVKIGLTLKTSKGKRKGSNADTEQDSMEIDPNGEEGDDLFDFDFNNSLVVDLSSKSTDCSRILNIFCNIGGLENILSGDIQAQLLILTAMMSVEEAKKHFGTVAVNGLKTGRIVECWMKFWSDLKRGTSSFSWELHDISKKLKETLKIDFESSNLEVEEQCEGQDLSLNLVNWLTAVAEKGFITEIFAEQEIKKWVTEAFGFIDSRLFHKTEQKGFSGLLEEQLTSNRIQNLIKAIFKFALALLRPGSSEEERVVDTIFDPLLILKPKSSQKITKGEVYQKYFIQSIPYCSKVLELTRLQQKIGMERIGKFVHKLLVSVKSTKKERLRFGTVIVEKTIEIWDQLSLNCTNDTIASLISGMASLNMTLCRNSVQLSNWWCGPNVMTCVNLSLKDKSNFIHFFGLFGLSNKDDIMNNVITTLYGVLDEASSVSVDWNTDENFILKIAHSVLKVFEEIPQNPQLLKLVSIVLSKVTTLSTKEFNSCSATVLKKIEQVVPTVQSPKEQMKMADTVYACIADSDNEDFRQSMVVTKYILLPILACIGERAAKEFFKKNINDIAKNAAIKPESNSDWHLKITALNLMEVLCLLKTSTLFFTGPELNSVYLRRLNRTPNPQDSKDCAKDIMKICTSFIPPVDAADSSMRKLIFQSNQAAANVLHAGLRVMGTPLKVVLNIVVKIAPTKTNPERWLNIIDSELSYHFPILLEAPKQTDVSGSEGAEGETSPAGEGQLQRQESNGDIIQIQALATSNNRASRKASLASSSLAMDATNYDFTAAVTIENSKFYQRLFNTSKPDSSAKRSNPLNMEWNLVNQHSCMTPFVETIRNFFKKRGESGNETLMTDLVAALNAVLKTPSQQYQNVRIFIISAILNCKDIFKFHARDLKDAILKAILPPQPCFGPELNYIFKDVLVMLLEWQEEFMEAGGMRTASESDTPRARLLSTEQIRQLLEFILPNIWHERKDVLSQHLEILEAVVQTWVSKSPSEADAEIPFEKVTELIAQSENRVGLEVCKHILLGGQLPCLLNDETGNGFDLKKLFHTVSKTFGSTSKITYGLGGQLIGLLFRQLEKMGYQTDLSNAVKFTQKVLDKERNKPQQLLTILNNIQTYYEPFVGFYKSTILELLRNENTRADALNLLPGILTNEIKNVNSMEDSMVLKNKTSLEDFFSDLDGRGVFRNPCKTELEAQAAVKILTEFLNNGFRDEHRFLTMLQWAEVEAEKSTDLKLRTSYAMVVSKLYYNFGGRREKSVLSTKAHKLFIRLHNDTNKKIKEIVADFWERNLKSWKDSPSLILELMEILGDEKNAIPISIDLIMKRCGLSPDYEKQIFSKDLGECVFQKYNLDTSWRMRHSTFQPLYAESLSSSQNFSQFPKSLQVAVMSQRQTSGAGGAGMNVLRATLRNLQFSPTAPGQLDQSQSSLMGESSERMDIDFGGSFNSDRFYSSFHEQDGESGSDRDEDGPGTTGRTDGDNATANYGSQNVLARLRKRFYERPATQQLASNFFARRAQEKQEAQVEREVEAIRSKRSGIKLIRSYRIGELPDIMMKHSDFLATISAMTKNDEETGRNFLVHLFTSILKEVEGRDPTKAKRFAANAVRTFESLLRKYGSSISPEFGATILEIAIVNGEYIKIEADLVSDAGRNFDLQELAILKLEGVLEDNFKKQDLNSKSNSKDSNREENNVEFDLEPQSKKARLAGSGSSHSRNSEAECSIILLRIAQLYKDLEDFEAVRSVFLMAGDKTNNEDLSSLYKKGCEALRYESEGKFDHAFELYDQLCRTENELDSSDDYFGEERFQLWDASAYQCLEQLSKWDEVYERAESFVNHTGTDYNSIFKDNVYANLILPHQLSSAVQILIRDQESSADGEGQEDDDEANPGAVALKDKIRDFIELLKMTGSIWEGLVEEYIDLSILSIHYDNDIGHTSSWLDKNLSKSLQKFYTFPKCSKLEQKVQLRTLQRTSALQDYINWHKNCRLAGGAGVQDTLEKETLAVISKWKHSGTSRTSSLLSADIVVAEKNYLLWKIGDYAEEKLENFQSLFDAMKIANYKQHLWLVDLSIRNHNNTVAWKTFRMTKNISDGLEEKLMVDFKILLSEYLTSFTEEDERWDAHWVTCWKSLRKLERDEELRSSFWEVKTNLLNSLLTKLSLGRPLDDDSKIRKQLGISSSANLIQHITKMATNLGKNVVESYDVEVSSARSGGSIGSTCNINIRLYHLLKDIKRKCERGLTEEDISQLHLYILTSLLRAMKHGEMESLRLFPTSFTILEKYPQLLPTFREMVVGIPSWMFLPWLDQIVVNFKNNDLLKEALNDILERIVADFPQAFQLQYTDLLLKRKKSSDVYALYSEALTAVTVPSLVVKEYLPKQNYTMSNLAQCLDQLKRKMEDIKNKSHIYGDLHQTYINNFLPKVNSQIKRLQEAGSHSDFSDSQEDQESPQDAQLVKSIVDQLQHIWKAGVDSEWKDASTSKTVRLDLFSPWLAKFRSSKFQDYLEIPGLYSEFQAPNTNFHPKIVSFHPTVLQIRSLTNPIRLTFLCNNGKEVRFLVKKGDDLRQDKRIQQCFRVANEIFKGDPHCRERRLQIMTYNVIPITNDFGLIEWVDKTVSLKRLILNSRKLEEVYTSQREQYRKWIGSTAKNPIGAYHSNAKYCGRVDAEKNFNACRNRLSAGLLREHIIKGCNSLEGYFTLREKIIRSYATMCFVHWLLGIGDRHLENSLISTETGEFLGIDFGRSFGIAIFKQDIPELIPFRLTPQIQNLLQPYGTNGLFKETMLCAKRAMKKSAELLIAVADVFIKEPLTDWLKNRDRTREGESNVVPEHDEEQEGHKMELEGQANIKNDNLDRIKILTNKLMGKNPISIIGQDIQKLKAPLRTVYLNILKDGKGESAVQQKLTEEEYVDVLIALATDPNILSRLFEGWSSWL